MKELSLNELQKINGGGENENELVVTIAIATLAVLAAPITVEVALGYGIACLVATCCYADNEYGNN